MTYPSVTTSVSDPFFHWLFPILPACLTTIHGILQIYRSVGKDNVCITPPPTP